MNFGKRCSLEARLEDKNIEVTMEWTDTVLGSFQKKSKVFQLEELTDLEIHELWNNIKWGLTNGSIVSRDRTGDAILKFTTS